MQSSNVAQPRLLTPHAAKAGCRSQRMQGQRNTRHLGAVDSKATQGSAKREIAVAASSVETNGATVPLPASLEDISALLDRVNCFIFDCDGVIWRGDCLIDDVPETLDYLRSLGKKLVFVTNNSTKSRAGYVKKFTDLGLQVTPDEIFSSSFAAAAYLRDINFDRRKKVYVIGEVGILEELELENFEYLGGPEDGEKRIQLTKGYKMEHDPDVGAVVVGFDRYVNYYKLQYATLCIRENPGCLFIATNTDAVTHLTDAQEWAGGGCMVGAIRGSTRKEPIIVGKPADFMLKSIADRFQLKREQICMVGDRLDTDILFGKNGGLTTCLVLSGVTTEAELLGPENNTYPDMYMSCLPEVLKLKETVSR